MHDRTHWVSEQAAVKDVLKPQGFIHVSSPQWSNVKKKGGDGSELNGDQLSWIWCANWKLGTNCFNSGLLIASNLPRNICPFDGCNDKQDHYALEAQEKDVETKWGLFRCEEEYRINIRYKKKIIKKSPTRERCYHFLGKFKFISLKLSTKKQVLITYFWVSS